MATQPTQTSQQAPNEQEADSHVRAFRAFQAAAAERNQTQQDHLKTFHEYTRAADFATATSKAVTEHEIGRSDNNWKVGIGAVGALFSMSKTSKQLAQPFMQFLTFIHDFHKSMNTTSVLKGRAMDAAAGLEDFYKRHPEYRPADKQTAVEASSEDSSPKQQAPVPTLADKLMGRWKAAAGDAQQSDASTEMSLRNAWPGPTQSPAARPAAKVATSGPSLEIAPEAAPV